MEKQTISEVGRIWTLDTYKGRIRLTLQSQYLGGYSVTRWWVDCKDIRKAIELTSSLNPNYVTPYLRKTKNQ